MKKNNIVKCAVKYSVNLIRINYEKKRAVYFCGTHYRKIWENIDPDWIKLHVKNLDLIFPGYVINFGLNWIDYKVIEGKPASEFPHTKDFIKKIHDYCLTQINETKPWFHGDWTLSNMIINGETITMIDWDNLGQYSEEEVLQKLKSDLKSAFGDLYVF